MLTWAIGLLLLDNCDFGALRARGGQGTKVGRERGEPQSPRGELERPNV